MSMMTMAMAPTWLSVPAGAAHSHPAPQAPGVSGATYTRTAAVPQNHSTKATPLIFQRTAHNNLSHRTHFFTSFCYLLTQQASLSPEPGLWLLLPITPSSPSIHRSLHGILARPDAEIIAGPCILSSCPSVLCRNASAFNAQLVANTATKAAR